MERGGTGRLALKETEEVDADEPARGCSLTIFDGCSAAGIYGDPESLSYG
jgi:hypothetical protein